MSTTQKARVQSGMAFLDNAYPGWASKVDINMLDQGRGGSCVLSQVLDKESWYDAMTEAGLTNRLSVGYGFLLQGESDGTYETLNKIWREAISSRINPIASALSKSVSNLRSVILTDAELDTGINDGIKVFNLELNGDTVTASWPAVIEMLSNMEPSDLKVTLR